MEAPMLQDETTKHAAAQRKRLEIFFIMEKKCSMQAAAVNQDQSSLG
jgi:hypothetical protein